MIRIVNRVMQELQLGTPVADIDNDGDEDIYICYLNSKNKLLINDGNGMFLGRLITTQSCLL